MAFSVQMTLDKNTKEMDSQIEENAELRKRVSEFEQNKTESAQATQLQQEIESLRKKLEEELKMNAQLAAKNTAVIGERDER